jgi:hypothetical protein
MYIEAQNPRQKGTKDDKSISSVVSLSVQPPGQPCVDRLRLIAIVQLGEPGSLLSNTHRREARGLRDGLLMVEVTNALQPLPQRQLRIVPLDLVKEISATASGLRRKSLLDQLCNDLLGGELEDRAVLVLDLLVGLIDQVEDRMGV